jgi:hypothetical protein
MQRQAIAARTCDFNAATGWRSLESVILFSLLGLAASGAVLLRSSEQAIVAITAAWM